MSWRRAIPYSQRHRGPFVGAVAVRAVERGGERLGRQVGGGLRAARAAREVGDHPGDVAAVEDGERLWLRAGRREELVVGARVHLCGLRRLATSCDLNVH